FDLWSPPEDLIDKSSLPGATQHGIGRPCKVGKEQIAGLVTALKHFVETDEETRRSGWLQTVETLADGLRELDGLSVRVFDRGAIPSLHVKLEKVNGKTMTRKLNANRPGVHVNASRVHEDVLVLNPVCLREGDTDRLIDVFRATLAR
ncbi:MAG: hypothetical protein CME21_20315, partial [Gemmatimonadetes bacterium]|nr:hypothetical protein [Gemmatimonadota bacterium]